MNAVCYLKSLNDATLGTIKTHPFLFGVDTAARTMKRRHTVFRWYIWSLFTHTDIALHQGIHLRRDSWVSVMYAEELNSTTSSVTLRRTDRQGIVGQKSSHFQLFL